MTQKKKQTKKQNTASEESADDCELGEISKTAKTKRSQKNKQTKKQNTASEESADDCELGEISKTAKTKRSQKNKQTKKQNTASEESADDCELSEISKTPKTKRSQKKKESTDSLDELEGQISNSETCCISAQIQSEARSCCIYAAPVAFTSETNGKKKYQPQVVSIGPCHYSEVQVKAMKKHKRQFLSRLLHRKHELSFDDLLKSIRPLATKARECYSKEINLEYFNDTDRFLKMMVLDGCFLIELFLKADKRKLLDLDDPLPTMAWALPYIDGDLLLLQNQIPFFVLEKLFDTCKMGEESDASLPLLALRFFHRPDEVIEKFRNQTPLHLLDLVRSSFLITPDLESSKKNEGNTQPCRLIYCISKLRRAGIKLERRERDSFLDVKFRKGIFGNGVIEMPNITMDNRMKSFLVNCVAFEQLHNSRSKQFTVYARFLDCLVDTARDVDYLCNHDIFDNYFGKDGDVVQFINKMGKDLRFDDEQFYLSQLFKDVDKCYRNNLKKFVASCKARYCSSPWSCISAVAALVLLVLTLLQTFYTIYAYVNPN